MQKTSTKLLVIAITTAAIIAATTTSLLNVQSAYAQNLHSSQKEHQWDSGLGGEGSIVSSLCTKDPESVNSCRGTNLNQDARQLCQAISGTSCKQTNLNKLP
jgi:hypothetical protein